MTKPTLAYIGLGLMGQPMTRHLVQRGYNVHGYDILEAQRVRAEAHGVRVHSSVAETVGHGDLVLLNLPTTQAVEEVVFGPQGVASVLRSPQKIVDFSTVKVAAGRSFIERLWQSTGCAWIDAPVSGGPMAAGEGSLTVMAGAREEDLPAIKDLMADVSARFTVVGPPGSGLVAKTINQLMVGCLNAVIAESVAMAEQAGIQADCIPQALTGGHADGVLFQLLYPRMRQRDFAPRGYARQLLKDLDMVQELAADLKLPTPMTAQAQSLFRMLIHQGHSELDTSAIFKLYEH